jgi:diacylglycerol O-acyltransferase / wax synthase
MGDIQGVDASYESRPVIERASSADLAFLAMDRGKVPEQFAVILQLERSGGLGLHQLRQLIEARICALPRLRQRLINVPPGFGRPVWVDDHDFRIERHVRAVQCSAPGDERALFEVAVSVIMEPLPKQAPLWSVVLITDLADGGPAVVVVLHHVLADGLGGLNVLATPTLSSLNRDAWVTRIDGLRRPAGSWQLLRRAMFAGGGFHPIPVTQCSLVQVTSPRRKVGVVKLDRAELAAAAHRYGATTNDAILVAIAGALQQVLLSRGESVDPIAVAVPVSGRRASGGRAVGNLVSPMLVYVPTSGGVGERLAQVEAAVRGQKEAATGPPPIAILGGLFRLLARLGGYHFYMNHQRRLHTLVTHVRGPVEPVMLGGRKVTSAIPVAVADGGNITISFEVLSYAGALTITGIVDPDHGPDLDDVMSRLQTELDSIKALP